MNSWYSGDVKHDLLKEVWRVRDELSAECGYDIGRLAARMRREERKYGDRLVRIPRRRKSVADSRQAEDARS
jgi:hypothetical protein